MSELVHSQLYQVRTFSIDVDVYDVDDMNQVKYGFLQILDGLGFSPVSRVTAKMNYNRENSRSYIKLECRYIEKRAYEIILPTSITAIYIEE